jgi:hypothetical protein
MSYLDGCLKLGVSGMDSTRRGISIAAKQAGVIDPTEGGIS